jgi:hypothetical protein
MSRLVCTKWFKLLATAKRWLIDWLITGWYNGSFSFGLTLTEEYRLFENEVLRISGARNNRHNYKMSFIICTLQLTLFGWSNQHFRHLWFISRCCQQLRLCSIKYIMLNNELARKWKALFWNLPKELRKTTKIINHDTRCSGRDTNWASLECKWWVLPTEPTFPVTKARMSGTCSMHGGDKTLYYFVSFPSLSSSSACLLQSLLPFTSSPFLVLPSSSLNQPALFLLHLLQFLLILPSSS